LGEGKESKCTDLEKIGVRYHPTSKKGPIERAPIFGKKERVTGGKEDLSGAKLSVKKKKSPREAYASKGCPLLGKKEN